MPQPKETPQRKRRRKAVPVLGAAGLSLSLASGASAAMGGVSAHPLTPVSQQMTLREEEISDVCLAAFHVFDKEIVGTQRPRARIAAGACGIGLYYPDTPPPVFAAPVYATRPVQPAHKYRHPGPVRPEHKYR
jgi:hypothetical protein